MKMNVLRTEMSAKSLLASKDNSRETIIFKYEVEIKKKCKKIQNKMVLYLYVYGFFYLYAFGASNPYTITEYQ